MRRAFFGMAASIGASLLAACTVGPNFRPPAADTPADWTALKAPVSPAPGSVVTATALADAAWWKSFDDPELSSLVERALAANIGAKRAVLRIEEARAERRIAAAAAWPTLDATAGYTDTRLSERTATSSVFGALSGASKGSPPPGVAAAIPGLANPFSQYQYGLTSSWEIDLFGRVRRSVEAANADTAAATADRDAVRVALMAEVAAAYIDLRGAQARLAVTRDSVETSKTLLKLASDARAAGLGDDLDIANARAVLAGAQAALPPLGNEVATDQSQLELLLAAKPGTLEAELDAARAIPPLPAQVPVGLPSELARRRPDIREAEAELLGATARQSVAVASLYPTLTLNLAAGLEASDTASLAAWAARYMILGPSLDLPIFDAGRRQETVHIADVHAKEAALTYAQAVLGALHEVDDAITAYDQEQSRRQSLETAVSEGGRALGLAERRYRAGSVSFRDVLDAQHILEQSELALTASTAAASEDLVTLYKALGGGWEAGSAG
ncbi:MAG TPA: efflux transporter outer membrane subunit [Caulobacteraceae bacterium]|nr:efflux transporter outer membrane subunit [Caulobacteraceae bacterium]